jgi:hypothetical protein
VLNFHARLWFSKQNDIQKPHTVPHTAPDADPARFRSAHHVE